MYVYYIKLHLTYYTKQFILNITAWIKNVTLVYWSDRTLSGLNKIWQFRDSKQWTVKSKTNNYLVIIIIL